jgi:hypothetical protein
VSLSVTHDGGADQLPLFESATVEMETPKQRRIAAAVDHLRSRLGRDAISFGRAGVSRRE